MPKYDHLHTRGYVKSVPAPDLDASSDTLVFKPSEGHQDDPSDAGITSDPVTGNFLIVDDHGVMESASGDAIYIVSSWTGNIQNAEPDALDLI